jgi:nitrate/nitrite transporter NarK
LLIRTRRPPRTWFYPNFGLLFAVALMPYFWWTTVFTVFTILWQNVYHWSAIMTAVRFIPIGVFAFAMSFTGGLARRISPKWIILSAQLAVIVATILLAFADSEEHYWPFAFPAFIIGTTGAMLTYTHTK